MPRMSKKRKLELSFFLNDRGRVAYNDLCRKCQHMNGRGLIKSPPSIWGQQSARWRNEGYRPTSAT